MILKRRSGVALWVWVLVLHLAGVRGTAAGLFPEEVFPAGDRPTSIEQADLDGDGRLDLVVTSDASTEVSILFGRPDGSFLPRVTLGTPDRDLAQSVLADFDGDGRLDIAVTSLGAASWIFLGQGGGAFGSALPLPVGVYNSGLAAAHLNDDPFLDLAVSEDRSSGRVFVLLGDGGGGFAEPLTSTTDHGSRFLRARDVDLDGNVDLVGSFGVRRGLGDGTFEPFIGVAQAASDGVIEDFNGDDRPDLAFVFPGSAFEAAVYLSGPQGGFSPPTLYPLPWRAGYVQSGDLDGNGRPDLLISTGTNDEALVLLSDAGGAFGAPTIFPLAFVGGPAVTADYDGDGRIDVAMTSFDSEPKAVSQGVAWVSPSRSLCRPPPVRVRWPSRTWTWTAGST